MPAIIKVVWLVLSQARIDISGIGFGWQRAEPARNGERVDPIAMFEALALPPHGIEAGVPERAATFDARKRELPLDQRKLERQSFNRLAKAGQCLGLETFNVDLDEGGRAVGRDQSIEARQRNADALGPCLVLPAGRVGGGRDEIRRYGRDGRIVEIDI